MEGPPLRPMIHPGAKPVACHTPIDVPIHWRDDAKAGLDLYCKKGASLKRCRLARLLLGAIARLSVKRRTTSLGGGWIYRHLTLTPPGRLATHRPFHQARSVPHGTKKTVCDAWNGYHAIPLHPNDKHFTTFITPWGRYRYSSAPQGYVTSGDGFTRRFDEIIAHIPNKTKCVDDTLLWADSIDQAFW